HFAVSFYLVDAIAANVRIAGPDNSSGFGDGAITTESQNDHGSSESGFSGRLAFSPIGTQALQELLGSKLLVLSQRTSGLSLIKSITMPNISDDLLTLRQNSLFRPLRNFFKPTFFSPASLIIDT